MTIPIADLHSDLLFYLELNNKRTPYDKACRTSVDQLQAGGVKLQVLTLFTQTVPSALNTAAAQLQLFKQLPQKYGRHFMIVKDPKEAWAPSMEDRIGVMLCYENGSGFCSEQEPLQKGLDRLQTVIEEVARPVYISLTWNTENRFGGGALTSIGLKEDGKKLLESLHQQKIAIDLSHASDALANDVLDYLENKHLEIPVMASHSNARRVTAVPRNLPDPIAKEIFRKGGLIGLNLYAPFNGPSPEYLLKQIDHWFSMGGGQQVCFGADFFYETDFPPSYLKAGYITPYLNGYEDASCYQRLLQFIQKELKFSDELIEGLAHRHVLHYLKSLFSN